MNYLIARPELALRIVEIMATISVALASLEYLARPEQFMASGLLNWEVSRSRSLLTSESSLRPILDVLFSFPQVLWLIRIRLFAAITLLIPDLSAAVRLASCAIVLAMSLLLVLRTHFGNDGADQMSTLIFGALVLMRLHPTNLTVRIALAFIAAQAVLAYVTSGFAKLPVKKWQSGEHLIGVFRTSSYGHRLAGRILLNNPRLARCAAILVIAGECTFPLVLVLPFPYSLPWLVGGLGFHVGAAVLMGLDTFFWSFAASYPAIIYSARLSAHWLHLR